MSSSHRVLSAAELEQELFGLFDDEQKQSWQERMKRDRTGTYEYVPLRSKKRAFDPVYGAYRGRYGQEMCVITSYKWQEAGLKRVVAGTPVNPDMAAYEPRVRALSLQLKLLTDGELGIYPGED